MSPSGNGATAFMDGVSLDSEAALFQGKTEALHRRRLLRINPDNKQAVGTQELQQPVQRRFEGFERTPAPIHQGSIVLARRTPTIGGRRCVNIAAAMHVQHQLDGL